MNTLNHSGTNFFLTGGTALSRAYYHHRYSDDLDFFLSQSDNYDKELDKALDLLSKAGFVWNVEKDYVRVKNFTTIKVGLSETNLILKLDFDFPHLNMIALQQYNRCYK